MRPCWEAKDMEKLNFPVFKEPLPGPPILSMDQYLRFVEECRWLFNKRAYEKQKQEHSVNVPFRLK